MSLVDNIADGKYYVKRVMFYYNYLIFMSGAALYTCTINLIQAICCNSNGYFSNS